MFDARLLSTSCAVSAVRCISPPATDAFESAQGRLSRRISRYTSSVRESVRVVILVQVIVSAGMAAARLIGSWHVDAGRG